MGRLEWQSICSKKVLYIWERQCECLWMSKKESLDRLGGFTHKAEMKWMRTDAAILNSE